MPVTDELPPVVKDALTPQSAAKRDTARRAAAADARPPAAASDNPPDAATIQVPLGEIREGFLSSHVEARLATDKQRRNLRRMLLGLRASGAKLENGRFVNTQADLIKWLLEQPE